MPDWVGVPVPLKVIVGFFARDHASERAWRVGCFENHGNEGKKDSNDHAVDRAEEQNAQAGCHEDIKFIAADFEQTDRQMRFHDIHQGRDHDRGQDRDRQIADETCKTGKEDCHDKTGSQGNGLRGSSVLFVHGSTGNTSVYRAAANSGGRDVSGRTGKDFLAVV